MKKAFKTIGIILLCLAVIAGAGAGIWITAAAEPTDDRFDDAQGSETLDMSSLLSGLLGGKVVISPQILNATVQSALEENPEEHLNQILLMPDESTEGVIWARAWVDYLDREWVATIRFRAEVQKNEETVTALRLIPTKIAVGKLEIPGFLWSAFMDQAAEEVQMPCEDGEMIIRMDEFDNTTVSIKDVQITPDGVVLSFAVNWGDIDWGNIFQ